MPIFDNGNSMWFNKNLDDTFNDPLTNFPYMNELKTTKYCLRYVTDWSLLENEKLYQIPDLIPRYRLETNKYYDERRIQKEVANFYKVSFDDLKSKKRLQSLVIPRQVAMYLCRKLTDESFERIGLEFGGKNHTTVMHAVDKIKKEILNDDRLNNEIQKMINEITEILNGDTKILTNKLEQEMKKASEALNYEKALDIKRYIDDRFF